MKIIEDNSIANIQQYVDVLVKLARVKSESLPAVLCNELINKVISKLNAELDNAKGKKIVIDLASLPKEMLLDDWLRFFNDFGIAFVTSTTEEKDYTVPVYNSKYGNKSNGTNY